MPIKLRLAFALLLCVCTAYAFAADKPRVLLKTSVGEIVLELEPERAPQTVKNFLRYVEEGYYNGTIFHRIIRDFVVQAGGFDIDFKYREDGLHEPVPIEADNGLLNKRGTVAMARTNEPDSALSQFFINVADNAMLDFKEKTPQGWGYTVFGHVVEGMEVVDRIRRTSVYHRPGGFGHAPMREMVIHQASVVSGDAPVNQRR